MKQNLAISLVIGSLFALWLFNTGRVASFKNWLQTTPGQGTLPGGSGTPGIGSAPKGSLPRVGSITGSQAGVAATAACASAAAAGALSPGCAQTFLSELRDPIGTISAGVSTLTFGLVHL